MILGNEVRIIPSIGRSGKSQTWCMGNICPPDYTFPENWDIMGVVPSRPRKKHKKDIPGIQPNTDDSPIVDVDTLTAANPVVSALRSACYQNLIGYREDKGA